MEADWETLALVSSSTAIDWAAALELSSASIAAADAIFAKIDTNGSGTIEPQELLLHLLEAGQEPETVAELFRSLDLNSDGLLTPTEWRAGYATFVDVARVSSEAGEAADLD